jgi:hypothetical protein
MLAERFKKRDSKIRFIKLITMIAPTPLDIEEAEEISIKQTMHLDYKEFAKAQERFYDSHLVLPVSKLIFMMMNPMMELTIEDQASIRPLRFRLYRAIGQNMIFNDGLQGVARAVFENSDVHTNLSFLQTYDRILPLAPRLRLSSTRAAPRWL